MPFPLIPLIMGLAMGAGEASSAIGGRSARRDARDENALDRELQERRMALDESMANPFRHQLNQARSVNMLEGMANSSYTRPQLSSGGAYGQSRPTFEGGFSFESGPEGPAAARALQGTVMRGLTRPDDRSGGIDLVSLLAGDGGDLWAADAPTRTAVPRATSPYAIGARGVSRRG
jgi:hypothetical protein